MWVSGSFLERQKWTSTYHRWSTDNRSKNWQTNEFIGVSYESMHNSYITKQPNPTLMITHNSHIPGFPSQLAGGSMEEAPLPQQLVTTSITCGGTLKILNFLNFPSLINFMSFLSSSPPSSLRQEGFNSEEMSNFIGLSLHSKNLRVGRAPAWLWGAALLNGWRRRHTCQTVKVQAFFRF